MKNLLIKIFILFTVFIINCFAQLPGWEVVQSGTNINLNSIYFYNHQTGIACGNSGIILKSKDGGMTWQSLPTPVAYYLNDCIMFSEDCFLAVGDSASWLSTNDGGHTWFSTQSLDIVSEIYSISFSRNQGVSYGIFGADSQKIMIGTTYYCGTVIHDVYGGSPGGFYGTHMLTSDIGFVAGENSISQLIFGRSTNAGNNWEYISFYLNGNEGRATGVAFVNQLIGFISAKVWDGRGAIAKTTDYGNNWTTTFFSKPLHSINFPSGGTNLVGYSVGDAGTILKTYDAGVTWLNQFSGTDNNLKKVFFIDSNFGFAVGENGTILRTTTGGGSVVGIDNEAESLHKFELLQNYPNPFNPTTKISWQSPVNGWQSLKIYDMLGNEILTLVNAYKPAGKYEVSFYASGLPSGIYIYQLIAGNNFQSRKMILLR